VGIFHKCQLEEVSQVVSKMLITEMKVKMVEKEVWVALDNIISIQQLYKLFKLWLAIQVSQ